MSQPISVLIAGGGVAGLEAALTLRELLRDRVDLTMVSDADTFHFRPLGVGEPFGLGAPHRHDLLPIARRLRMRFVEGRVARVLADDRQVQLASGERLSYDHLLVAVGAPSRSPSPFGVLFERGSNAAEFDEVLADLQAGLISHVAFVVPRSVSWPLPAYELALMTAAWGAAARPDGVRITLATHEFAPLELFGAHAAATVARLLDDAGIAFVGGHDPVLESDTLLLSGNHQVQAERVVILPELVGPAIPGLPERRGFLPVDPWGRVTGAPAVYAVGDAADHPLKHGGLAAQQATSAAAAIAHDAVRAPVPALPRPILRGLLRTVEGPLYLRAAIGEEETTSTASRDPLWWPPSKLAAPRLTSLISAMERERVEGIVLPTGGLTSAAVA
jgi:sulfide:quinone oxidoreductase